jgi:hypothetical protein
MKEYYTITLIPEDFEGDRLSIHDCIGYRAFKRATGFDIDWLSFSGALADGTMYGAYLKGEPVGMMHQVSVGDTIVFKQLHVTT